MAKKFEVGRVNLTGNPYAPSSGGGASPEYFNPQMMQLLGQNAPKPELSGMQKFAQFFQNPQAQQALQGLAPLLFGAFGGPEMGAGALKTFDTQAAIRRQQEEIDAERQQREQALGISRERLGLEKEELGARTKAAETKATAEAAEATTRKMTDVMKMFETSLAQIDTTDESALRRHALSFADAANLNLDQTQKILRFASSRAGLKPAGKPPATEVFVGPKGEIGTGSAFPSGVGQSYTGVPESLVTAEAKRRGGGTPKERNFQAKEIYNPADPSKPMWANYDPDAGKYLNPDTDEVIKGAKPYVAPKVVDPALQALREAGLKQLQYTEEDRMRTQYQRDIKDYPAVEDAVAVINEMATKPSAASDMAMVIGFNKLNDPGSVVRESEFARTAAMGSLAQRVQIAYNKMLTGEALEPALRAQIVEATNRLHKAIRAKYESLRTRYREMATGRNLNADYVAPQTLSVITPGPEGESAPGAAVPVNPFRKKKK